jgi:hypothetical protein
MLMIMMMMSIEYNTFEKNLSLCCIMHFCFFSTYCMRTFGFHFNGRLSNLGECAYISIFAFRMPFTSPELFPKGQIVTG